ncbi:unnamed protein product [Caenorhabditis bovis]|uniref:Uncharacterized protein n=1 Tax=Caenorhabditis bovis TaxID=2654633 RepID=A0A8S1FDD5_9PELO|nr:unnamed protein product [Caenorhabditis bovis]
MSPGPPAAGGTSPPVHLATTPPAFQTSGRTSGRLRDRSPRLSICSEMRRNREISSPTSPKMLHRGSLTQSESINLSFILLRDGTQFDHLTS